MSQVTASWHILISKIDIISLKLGTFIGVLVAAPLENKIWAGAGYILGVLTTWAITRRKKK